MFALALALVACMTPEERYVAEYSDIVCGYRVECGMADDFDACVEEYGAAMKEWQAECTMNHSAIDACLDESRAFYEECREDYSDGPGDDPADACASLCE